MGIAVGRPKRAARIGPVRHLFASQARAWPSKVRAWAERPPLWGNDDVSAMRNYRYRHRDSPYVARRSGNEHPEPDDRGRSAANFPERGGAEGLGVRDVAAVQGAVAAPTRGCRFFSSTSTLGCGAQGVGGAERRTDQFSVRFV